MRSRSFFVLAAVLTPAVMHTACGDASENEAAPACSPEAAAPVTTSAADASADALDPRCATKAVGLPPHPHAIAQDSSLGRTIADIRGWHGRLYFAYGDLELNTGPMYISSLDPKTKSWTDHELSYRDRDTGNVTQIDTFDTHNIPRFNVTSTALYAPSGQPMGNKAPEFAVGTVDHQWSAVDMADAIHVGDIIERAPGDLYVGGSALTFDPEAGVANGRSTAHIWRSIDGGPFTQLFPRFGTAPGEEWFDLSGAWVLGAALKGEAYFDVAGFIYRYDGQNWELTAPVGAFVKPQEFTGHLVFSDLDQLYAFDGTKRTNLEFRLFESQGRFNGAMQSLAIVQATEGKLLAASFHGDLMMTTDLVHWQCIGQVPAEATSVTSIDGTVYFGGTDGRVFGYEARSW